MGHDSLKSMSNVSAGGLCTLYNCGSFALILDSGKVKASKLSSTSLELVRSRFCLHSPRSLQPPLRCPHRCHHRQSLLLNSTRIINTATTTVESPCYNHAPEFCPGNTTWLPEKPVTIESPTSLCRASTGIQNWEPGSSWRERSKLHYFKGFHASCHPVQSSPMLGSVTRQMLIAVHVVGKRADSSNVHIRAPPPSP